MTRRARRGARWLRIVVLLPFFAAGMWTEARTQIVATRSHSSVEATDGTVAQTRADDAELAPVESPVARVGNQPPAAGATAQSSPHPALQSGMQTLAASQPSEVWSVTGVIDGDTIDVTRDGRSERVRVIGIDTPERGICGYSEASAALRSLVGDRDVELSPGAVDDRDRYGRLLRYVDVNGADAGLALLEQGYAIARYDSRDGYGFHPRETAYVPADAATPDTCPNSAAVSQPRALTGGGSASDDPWTSCSAAEAAGAAPVLRGDARYGAHLDGDGDGVGCEQ